MTTMYKLEFEVVTPIGKGFQFYYNEHPNCKPSEVPDEFWHKVVVENSNPHDQYNTLCKWVKEGVQLVRNVKLFELTGNPEWKLVERKD